MRAWEGIDPTRIDDPVAREYLHRVDLFLRQVSAALQPLRSGTDESGKESAQSPVMDPGSSYAKTSDEANITNTWKFEGIKLRSGQGTGDYWKTLYAGAESSDNSWTFPVGVGTSGEFLQSSGSGGHQYQFMEVPLTGFYHVFYNNGGNLAVATHTAHICPAAHVGDINIVKAYVAGSSPVDVDIDVQVAGSSIMGGGFTVTSANEWKNSGKSISGTVTGEDDIAMIATVNAAGGSFTAVTICCRAGSITW